MLISDDAIRVYICDRCRERIWIVDGAEVDPELAAMAARWLDDQQMTETWRLASS